MLSIMENPEIANIQHAFYRFCHLLTSMFFMSKGYKNFLTWIKSELQAGHHVTIGVTDEKDFSYCEYCDSVSPQSCCVLTLHLSRVLNPIVAFAARYRSTLSV